MEKKHLSDVLTVSEIINYSGNRVCILAGVGAGKNTFITKHLKDCGNIFFVSSRRATVDQMLLDEICKEKVDWNKFSGEIFTTTNFGVELLVKNEKFSSTGIKNLIEHFDIFVIDEFHSLKADATFATAAFHVYTFLDHISQNYPNAKIVVMTGTEDPVKDILKRDNYKIIDKRHECINILPNKIEVITKKEAIEIMRQLPDGQQTVYYTNSAHGMVCREKNAISVYEKLTQNNGYKTSEIAFTMSNSTAESIMKGAGLKVEKNRTWKNAGKRKDKVEEIINEKFQHIANLNRKVQLLKRYLTQKERLPSSVRILLTTSTLKEGVNIKSQKIKIAFCDSHLLSDIQQFAGRFRNGLDTLYIISDGKQFDVSFSEQRENFMDVFFCVKMLKTVNCFFSNQISNENSILYDKNWGAFNQKEIEKYNLFLSEDWSIYKVCEAAQIFIDWIESKFNFIRYNHLNGKFEIFTNAYREKKRIYEYYSAGWSSQVIAFCEENQIAFVNNAMEKPVDTEELSRILESYLHKKLTKENEKSSLLSMLANKLHVDSLNAKLTTYRKHLRINGIPYTLKDGNTTRNGHNIRYLEVIPYEEKTISKQVK